MLRADPTIKRNFLHRKQILFHREGTFDFSSIFNLFVSLSLFLPADFSFYAGVRAFELTDELL